MAIQNVTHGSVTFPFDIGGGASKTTGTYVDGVPYIVIPSGSITLNEPTPVKAVSGGRTINGSAKNPAFDQVPFDSEISNFNGTYEPTYPLSLTAGDCVVKVISQDPLLETDHSGVVTQWACIHIVAAAPGANDFSPPPFWTTAAGAKPTLTCDVDALAATMPSLSTSGMTFPTWTEVSWYFDKFNPGLACNADANGYGYQAAMVYASGINSGNDRNWGGYAVKPVNAAMALLLSDAATTAEKKAIIKRIIQRGAHDFFAQYSAGTTIGNNGGHFQFHQAVCALALKWSGHSDKIKSLMTYMRGNFAQCFYVDQAHLDAMTPHNSDVLPSYSRLRNVDTAYSAPYVYLEIKAGDTGNEEFDGLRLIRQSDSAVVTVTASSQTGGKWRITPSADMSPTMAVGQAMYFAHPAGWTPSIGDADWAISPNYVTTDNSYNPSYATGYRSLNKWAMQIMALAYFGTVHPTMKAAVDYVERANTSNNPLSGFDFPTHFGGFTSSAGTDYNTFEEAFWNAHWATCKSQPRSVTFADSFTVTNS